MLLLSSTRGSLHIGSFVSIEPTEPYDLPLANQDLCARESCQGNHQCRRGWRPVNSQLANDIPSIEYMTITLQMFQVEVQWFRLVNLVKRAQQTAKGKLKNMGELVNSNLLSNFEMEPFHHHG